MQPGIDPSDCPNYRTCGSATELTPEEQVELVRVREVQHQHAAEAQEQARQEWERVQEQFRVTRREAAVVMLTMRGCPQTPESLGVTAPLEEIAIHLETMRSHLSQFEGSYIAPEGCESHRYNVKRLGGIYWYNKLTAAEALFEPVVKEEKVRVIHLSYDDDPRNREGRLGIERRNRLTQIRTQLQMAEAALERAAALASAPLEDERVGSSS